MIAVAVKSAMEKATGKVIIAGFAERLGVSERALEQEDAQHKAMASAVRGRAAQGRKGYMYMA